MRGRGNVIVSYMANFSRTFLFRVDLFIEIKSNQKNLYIYKYLSYCCEEKLEKRKKKRLNETNEINKEEGIRCPTIHDRFYCVQSS